MAPAPILIVGAGIGGLSAALALQRLGHRVAIYEQAPRLTEVGAGLALASNATLVLQHLGLKDALLDLGVMPDQGAVKHYRTGRTLLDLPRGKVQLERCGAPYLQIHRADLQEALVVAVRSNDPGCLHTGHVLTDLGQDQHGVTALFGQGEPVRGSLLIGCDGIRSTVRARLFGDEAPRFTGYVAWRGLVPMERLAASTVTPDPAIWIGPGNFLTRYRVRRGRLVSYLAISRTSRWVEEGWSVPSTVDAVLAQFREFDTAARTVLMATPPDHCFKRGVFEREPLASWTAGRVTLLGDAAHPTTPFLGQGAAMAIEDAMVLARAVVADGTVAAALARYERARLPRANQVMAASRDNGLNLTTADPDRYDPASHRNEESLGLAAYNAVTAPL